MAQTSVTMKSALLSVVLVLVFASLASTQLCGTGVCVEQTYCKAKATKSAKCKMQSKVQGVCCGMSNIPLGKDCVFTYKKYQLNGKCVPESSCAPYNGENVWKTSNNSCSETPSKNFFCCPEKLLKELDSSKFIKPVQNVEYPKLIKPVKNVDSSKPTKPVKNVDSSKLIEPVKNVRRNGATESQTLVQNVFPSCRTPDRRYGHCVPLQLCDHLNDPLRNERDQKKRNDILQKYKCPFNAIDSTSICCADPANSSSFIRHEKAKQLGLAKCGPIPTGNKVLAGEKAGLGQYPWMANLMYKHNKTHLEPKCGGSLIHPKYVLTAAHCGTNKLQNQKPPVVVRLGEYDLSKREDCEEGECAEPFKEYTVDKFIPHHKYRLKKREYDIALIRLKTAVTLVPGQIFPICLPLTATLLMLKPNKLTVTGWGLTESGKTSDVLLKADLVHVNSDLDECRKESMFCARGTEMQGNCRGDSGGPLQTIVPFESTYRTVLFGTVVGGGKKCSVKINTPGIEVLVGYHIHWILDNMDI